jgi:tetratricopeptide (TPR) repeat protein
MLTKEVMVTAPFVALLLDRVFLVPDWSSIRRRRGLLYLGLAASLCLLLLRGEHRSGSAGFDSGVSPWHYLLTQCGAVVHYLRLVVWPEPLVFDYGKALVEDWREVLPQALALLAGLAASLLALRRLPAAGFLGLAFFLILAPSSSVVPVATQTVAEHRMYLPLATLVCFAVAALHAAARRTPTRSARDPSRAPGILPGVALLVACSVAVVLGRLTWQRNEIYRTELGLWQDTVEKRPSNARAEESLGNALRDTGALADARAHLDRAVELDPGSASAFNHRGIVLYRMGRIEEALADYDRALERQPDFPRALDNRGIAHARLGEYRRAIADYTRALELAPGFPNPLHNRAVAWFQLGEYARAWQDVEAAQALGLAVNPELLRRLTEASGTPAPGSSPRPPHSEN